MKPFKTNELLLIIILNNFSFNLKIIIVGQNMNEPCLPLPKPPSAPCYLQIEDEDLFRKDVAPPLEPEQDSLNGLNNIQHTGNFHCIL